MNYENQPKIELHLHLDCSLSFDVVKQLKPSVTLEEYQDSFIAPAKCTDLADYLKRAIKGFELMQTKEQLMLVTFDLFKQLKADNVIYAEIRFAPLLHTLEGLSAEQVVEIVTEAVGLGIEKYGVHVGIILCTLRHYSEEQSMNTVSLVGQFKDTHVVGFDLAADEDGFPIDNHVMAFQFAIENNINCTAHAGEAKGSESIWETLDNFQPKRIGHGVRSTEDENLLLFLKNNKVHLEICLTSNIQVNVFDKIENHSIDEIYNSGISISINTDGRTISNTTLSKEYSLLHQTFNWNNVHFKKCNLEAIEHSFASDTIKTIIKSQIEKAY